MDSTKRSGIRWGKQNAMRHQPIRQEEMFEYSSALTAQSATLHKIYPHSFGRNYYTIMALICFFESRIALGDGRLDYHDAMSISSVRVLPVMLHLIGRPWKCDSSMHTPHLSTCSTVQQGLAAGLIGPIADGRIHEAAKKGHANCVAHYLYEARVLSGMHTQRSPSTGRHVLDGQDKFGNTPLHWASSNGHPAVAHTLLFAGAPIEALDGYGATALSIAAGNGHAVVAQLLIDHGARLDATDKFDWTPLHGAADNGHLEVARVLIAAGAAVDAPDANGSTPLHRPAVHGDTDMITLLLKAGAQVDAANNHGVQALHRAALNGEENVARLLLAGGADPSAQDEDGNTPLHLAKKYGNDAVVELLEGWHGSQGANTDILGQPT